jgi:hypothetical protein
MISFKEFSNLHHAITLLGMSGIGKTVLSTKLRESENWFHYSADYRIGTRYLSEHIIDNVKFKIMQMKDQFVAELLMSDSIYINHNISTDNLKPVSTFLGMYGDAKKGGLDKQTFLNRQELYRQAELSSMNDIRHFIQKSWNIYRCKNFINDASGSLCEIISLKDPKDKILHELIDQTLILHIKADKKSEKKLVERAHASPKPLFYNPNFIGPILDSMPNDGRGISPISFARDRFPSLLTYRTPKYDRIGKNFGFTIYGKDLFHCKNKGHTIPDEANFLKNVYQILQVEVEKSKQASIKLDRYVQNCLQRRASREGHY